MSSDKTKPLWLIQPRLDAGEYRDKLIGSVVKYTDLPLERRIPYQTDKLPRELVPNLDPKPVQIRNVRFWTKNIQDAKVSASVNEILEAFGEAGREESNERTATVARVWHMDSPGEKFKELCKNKQYFEELFDLLQSNHGQGYFITDIVTFTNLELSESSSKTLGAGAGAGVPLDPSLGLDVHARASFSIHREKGYSACYDGESIVFMGYRRVRLEKVTGARAKISRMFRGQKYGMTVRDNMDHWPEIIDRPVEGNVNTTLGPRTPKNEEKKELVKDEVDYMRDELGFDVEIVG